MLKYSATIYAAVESSPLPLILTKTLLHTDVLLLLPLSRLLLTAYSRDDGTDEKGIIMSFHDDRSLQILHLKFAPHPDFFNKKCQTTTEYIRMRAMLPSAAVKSNCIII
jgi:hypothetical protein